MCVDSVLKKKSKSAKNIYPEKVVPVHYVLNMGLVKKKHRVLFGDGYLDTESTELQHFIHVKETRHIQKNSR